MARKKAERRAPKVAEVVLTRPYLNNWHLEGQEGAVACDQWIFRLFRLDGKSNKITLALSTQEKLLLGMGRAHLIEFLDEDTIKINGQGALYAPGGWFRDPESPLGRSYRCGFSFLHELGHPINVLEDLRRNMRAITRSKSANKFYVVKIREEEVKL
jgi:hypothetical protein